MSSWGNNDNAANAPYWAVSSAIMNVAAVEGHGSAPTSANVAKLYANTAANAYITGATVGLFAVDAQEASTSNRVHTGWVMRTVGQGGRAGRVQEEVLVALSGMSADGVDGDAQTYANVSITLTGPTDGAVVANASFANVITFSTTAALDGNTSSTLTYQWQYLDGTDTWANIPANTGDIRWAGKTSATLIAMPATTANNDTLLRVVVTAADEGVTATSANATLTVS